MPKIKASSKISNNSKSIKTSKNKFIIIFAALFIAIIITIGIILFSYENYNIVVDNDNVEDFIENQNLPPNQIGYYEVQMNTTWNFVSSKKSSYNAYICNSNSNLNTVYFTILIENELVYTSPNLPVGTCLENIKLDKNLKKNSYPAIMKYHLLDDNNIEVSSLSVSMTIVIEN